MQPYAPIQLGQGISHVERPRPGLVVLQIEPPERTTIRRDPQDHDALHREPAVFRALQDGIDREHQAASASFAVDTGRSDRSSGLEGSKRTSRSKDTILRHAR